MLALCERRLHFATVDEIMAFAGSRTLVGFGKRHHLALLNSGRTDPTTPRTSRDEPVAFFHLALSAAVGLRYTWLCPTFWRSLWRRQDRH